MLSILTNFLTDKTKRFKAKLFGLFFIAFIIQVFLVIFLTYQVSIQRETTDLENITQRIKDDINFKNGTWDTAHYVADPNLPQTYPLYVFAANGFVIDRWKPVHGFLDTSDQKNSSLKPQTITTPTKQHWRIFSQPVQKKGRTFGVVTVTSYNSAALPNNEIDKNLTAAMNKILANITIKNESLDTSRLDPREIPYNISFQIVDVYNRIILKNNNTNSIDQIPNFIDKSYIGAVINGPRVSTINDSITNEPFLIVSTPIIDTNDYVAGVIVAGRSISSIYSILSNLFIVELLFGSVLLVINYFLISFFLNRFLIAMPLTNISAKKHQVQHIAFDKKTGVILLDEIEIPIPYATNQYYLCEAIFSSPKKKWELDELLERFGEDDLTNWRKVYDAMSIVNKKAADVLGSKLIIVKDKTYRINPALLVKLH